MILVNIINGLTAAIIFPDTVDECCKAWFGSIAFVLAAYYIAPTGKTITAIVVASVYCGIGVFAVLVGWHENRLTHSLWLTIITTVITVLASIFACYYANSLEEETKSNLLKESQNN